LAKDTQVFTRNLLALSVKNAELAQALSQCAPAPTIQFELSKSNHWVPLLRPDIIRPDNIQTNNHPAYLHSRFDPIKEGQRYLESHKKGGFLSFLGCGGGYHILPFINKKDVSTILILEKNLAEMRSILEQLDLCSILTDPRVKLLIDATPEQVQEAVLSYYLPGLEGDLQTVVLASRVNLEQDYFSSLVTAIKQVISRVADDFTVQSLFGKKWFLNTLANLEKAEQASVTLPPIKTAVVTGAGPSLELQIKTLKRLRKAVFLIATDTSLPCLLHHDLLPDLVISIDCQQVTYHHFLQGYPAQVPLVLDLASPPILTRFAKKLFFFASNHPLSFYITSYLRHFPSLDTSGGNVAYAALCLAEQLGAETIHLMGIDFAYPEGKAYARGTYLYPYFNLNASRTSPLETHLLQFLFRNDNLIKERREGTTLYTTKPMLNYKEKMELAIEQMGPAVKQEAGMGLVLRIKPKPAVSFPASSLLRFKSTVHTLFSQGASITDWRTFLTNYTRKVANLPLPYEPLGTYFEELTKAEKLVLLTLLPASTAIREELTGRGLSAANLLIERTKDWTLACLKQYLL
jgi:hypothetical protein